MKNKKNSMGFAPIIILVLIALAVVGYFSYKNYWPKLQSIVTPTPVATVDATANWKTYSTAKYSFSFKYPGSWVIKEVSAPGLDDQVWLAANDYSLPQGTYGGVGNGGRAPISFIISKNDLTGLGWSPEQWNDLTTSPYQVGGLQGIKKSGISKEGLSRETVISAKIGSWYINIIPLEVAEKQSLDQILSTFKFTKGSSPAPSSAGSISYAAPSSWQRFTTQNGLKLCLPPKWESNPYGTLTYNRDAGYQPQITIIQNIPYTSGSYADAYYNFWRQEYPNVSQLVTATQTNINGNTAFKFAPMGEAKTPPEGLTVVWFTSGKLWKAGLSNWSMINSSQTAFLKDFYTMINCSF